MIRILFALVLLMACLAAPDPGVAAAGQREVAQAGDVMPLGAVLRVIGQRYPGRALDAQLREPDGAAEYHIKWLGNDGTVREITVNARTGEILRVR